MAYEEYEKAAQYWHKKEQTAMPEEALRPFPTGWGQDLCPAFSLSKESGRSWAFSFI